MFSDERKYRYHKRLLDGKILIYEVPTLAHDTVSGKIAAQFRDYGRYVRSRGSTDIRIDSHGVLQPDGSIFIEQMNLNIYRALDAAGNPLPRIVLEVSYSEPYDSIFSLPQIYFSVGNGNGIRGVLFVIIRKSRVHNQFQMIACEYRYGVNYPAGKIIHHSKLPEAEVGRFSGVGRESNGQLNPPCDIDHIEFYRFPIESEDLWHCCDPQIMAGYNVDQYYYIDLHEVKRLLLAEVARQAN